jgi:electron transfer flavoprotein alpha subunit
MGVLIVLESEKGQLKSNSGELLSYGKALGNFMETDAFALSINCSAQTSVEKYGVSKAVEVHSEHLQSFNAKNYADCVAEVSRKLNCDIIVVSSSTNAKYMSGILAQKLQASYTNNIVDLPIEKSPFTVKRSVYSNKAFAHTQLNAAVKILGLTKNSFGQTLEQAETKTESLEVTTSSSSALEIKGQDTLEGQISIADADVVVSGGRGLKGPENWNMIEDLAEVLGAATACSKPVSDMGWRPHSEHVGQTGKPVASNLYIAIGISGAIQHLAGVSSSKVKVVINTDAEAPFVKAADYAVIGDAFEVVPQLIEKLKAFKIQNG